MRKMRAGDSPELDGRPGPRHARGTFDGRIEGGPRPGVIDWWSRAPASLTGVHDHRPQ